MILALTTSNEPGAVQSKTLLVWLASLAIENESCMRMRTIKLSSQCIVASTLGWWKDECFTCLSDFEIPPLWLWDEKIWLCRQTPSEIEKIFFLILQRMRICRQTPSEIEKIFFLILLRLRKFFFSFSWDWGFVDRHLASWIPLEHWIRERMMRLFLTSFLKAIFRFERLHF